MTQFTSGALICCEASPCSFAEAVGFVQVMLTSLVFASLEDAVL